MSGNEEAGTSKHVSFGGEAEARAANAQFWELESQPPPQEGDEDFVMPDGGEEGDDTTTDGDRTGGDDTTTDGGGPTDGGSENPPATKKRRERRNPRKPQVLANITEEITVVSDSGAPLEPAEVVKGYGMQLGCIVRESVSINTRNLRSEENERLVDLLITKLHKRYKFPHPYTDNLDRSTKVNRLAITKMSNALSSWRTRLKAKIDEGKSWEQIHAEGEKNVDEEEFNFFKEDLATEEARAWTAWGQGMRELNIGDHHLGSGGYKSKIPIWDKEDAELDRLGKDNPWLKIADLQLRYFVRARYYLDPDDSRIRHRQSAGERVREKAGKEFTRGPFAFILNNMKATS